MSFAVNPRWVSLCFLQGSSLNDPEERLNGAGTRVRHIALDKARDNGSKGVDVLTAAALAAARTLFDPNAKGRLILQSASAKQRPWRTV